MAIKLYIASTTSNLESKKNQQKIAMILDSKKVAYQTIDVSESEDDRRKMRDLMGNPKAVPPQLFNNDTYLGDFSAFEEALENESLYAFLKL